MRSELKKLGSNERLLFVATPIRKGIKTNSYMGNTEETILLKNVRNNNCLITDHLWFNYGVGFDEALSELVNEDQTFKSCEIEFWGRVTAYNKGYKGRRAEEMGEYREETDYKIERPTKIKVIKVNELNQKV